MKKEFDAIKMIRLIREESSRDYYSNKRKWLNELSELQGSEIKPFDNKRVKKSGRKSKIRV